MAKVDWDIRRVTAVLGGAVGIVLSILMVLHIFGPFGGLIAHDWVTNTIQIIMCGVIITGWGMLGWKIYQFHNFILFIVVGAVLIIAFGNLAGIILVTAGLFVGLAS